MRRTRCIEKKKCFTSGAVGFTLIELLIVVAIIGILLAISIPNLLEAQTRAKHARVQADLHAVATALESYYVDRDSYPPQGEGVGVGSQDRLVLLTTPIAYLTVCHIEDPFCYTNEETGAGNRYYKYKNFRDLVAKEPASYPPDVEQHRWGVFSRGPDQVFTKSKKLFGNSGDFKPDSYYDPSNGTTSNGDVFRTHKICSF